VTAAARSEAEAATIGAIWQEVLASGKLGAARRALRLQGAAEVAVPDYLAIADLMPAASPA
jgi:hypothetical protein